ncbi:MAG: nuclear transport factor 2 family protein [Cytophagales bacterium]|nr:nuclear transport factor 2 family protein [Cytophagales bacterium]
MEEHKEEILETISRLCEAYDKKNFLVVKTCLTDQVDVHFVSPQKTKSNLYQANEFAKSREQALKDLDTEHLHLNHRIKGDKKAAVCLCDFETYRYSNSQTDYYHSFGQYEYELLNTEEGWKIKTIREKTTRTEGNHTIHNIYL